MGNEAGSSNDKSDSRRIKSIDKVITLLEAFDEERPRLALSEATAILGVHKSSASRLLRQLAEHGFLARTSDGREYGIGIRLFEIGNLYVATNSLIEATHDVLNDLVRMTGHTAQVCVRDGTDSVVVGSAESSQLIRAAANLGGRLPLHASASGKVLLSGLQDNEVKNLVEGLPSNKLEILMKDISRVRRKGVCLVQGEYKPEILSVAAPIRNQRQRVAAALCLVAPNTREAKSRAREYEDATIRLAAEVSTRIGA